MLFICYFPAILVIYVESRPAETESNETNNQN